MLLNKAPIVMGKYCIQREGHVISSEFRGRLIHNYIRYSLLIMHIPQLEIFKNCVIVSFASVMILYHAFLLQSNVVSYLLTRNA